MITCNQIIISVPAKNCEFRPFDLQYFAYYVFSQLVGRLYRDEEWIISVLKQHNLNSREY